MADKQALAGLKGRASRQKSPSGKTEHSKADIAQKKRVEAVKLLETSVWRFKAGAGTVEVLLSGEGLNLPGLWAVILGPDKKTPVLDSSVIVEQPQQDDLAFFEFPITVKVIDAPSGEHYFALNIVICNGERRAVRIVDILEHPSVTFE